MAREALDEQHRHVSARRERERFGTVGGRGESGVDDHAGTVVQPGRGLAEQSGVGFLGELGAVGAGRVAIGEALIRRDTSQPFADFVGTQPLESKPVRQTARHGRFAAAGEPADHHHCGPRLAREIERKRDVAARGSGRDGAPVGSDRGVAAGETLYLGAHQRAMEFVKGISSGKSASPEASRYAPTNSSESPRAPKRSRSIARNPMSEATST